MKHFMALLICLLLAACGPRYVQDYDLFPPDNAAGKQCTMQCTINKEACEKDCYQDALMCENRNSWNAGVGYGYHRRGYWDSRFGSAFPSNEFCPTNACTQTCRATQLECHTACGGTIKEREPRCVSGC